MKHLIIAFSIIISALLFHSSCDRDKAEETFADYDSSVLNTQFSEQDSTISFRFTSKANWEITGIDEDSWISIDPMEGYSGSNELTIVISRNSNPEQRSAHFSIESNNSSLDFTFSQQGAKPLKKLKSVARYDEDKNGLETLAFSTEYNYSSDGRIESVLTKTGESTKNNTITYLDESIISNIKTTDNEGEVTADYTYTCLLNENNFITSVYQESNTSESSQELKYYYSSKGELMSTAYLDFRGEFATYLRLYYENENLIQTVNGLTVETLDYTYTDRPIVGINVNPTFLLISWWWDIDNFGDLMSEQHPLLLQGYFSSTNVNYPLKIEGGPNAVSYPALLVTTEYEYTFNDDGLPTEVKVAVITYLNFVPETSYSRFELSYIE